MVLDEQYLHQEMLFITDRQSLRFLYEGILSKSVFNNMLNIVSMLLVDWNELEMETDQNFETLKGGLHLVFPSMNIESPVRTLPSFVIDSTTVS